MPEPPDSKECHNAEAPKNSWGELVGKIQEDEAGGMEQLYGVFSRGIRFYLCRQLGSQDLEDRVHDTFLIVALAIRRGELREPERLMGYIRTIARRQVAAHIELTVQNRKHHVDLDPDITVADSHKNPEQEAIDCEREELALQVLRSIDPRDREILVRFYLKEQSQEEICQEMDLSDTQFRLLKSRAKARFGGLGKKKLARGRLASLLQNRPD